MCIIKVCGYTPKPWATNEWEWRREIAKEARKHELYNKEQLVGKVFDVEIIFYFTKENSNKPDLDNLVKPVLDTLFHPRNPQVKDVLLTGALFDVDDDRVFKLKASKKIVTQKSDEGAEINIKILQNEHEH